jgi:hypothetical protein
VSSSKASNSALPWLQRVELGLTLPNRTLKPPAVGFGKPVGKPRLPLKTEQIQKTKPKGQCNRFETVYRSVRTGYRSVSSVNRSNRLKNRKHLCGFPVVN